MANVAKLQSYDTQLNADCVEFCPFEPYYSKAIVGTYQLCESGDEGTTSTRVGRLSLHNINVENCDLTPVQLLDTPGILDIKWCRKKVAGDAIYLAAANALGQIILYQFDQEDCLISQQYVQSIGSDRLALSCDWFDGQMIAVSDSKGELSCLDVTSGGILINSTWKSHDYEAWVTSFDRHSANMIYSGGDDSCFRLWDVRDLNSAVLTNKKAHQMGVTSIETSIFDCNLLATGSYDERLLLWDKRQMKTWTSETSLGGGVWKLKWDPHSGRFLLVAAMHNGFHIVDCAPCSSEGNQEPQLVASYNEHSSLAYGCDWSRDPCIKNCKLIATCSFYDHCLQSWTWASS